MRRIERIFVHCTASPQTWGVKEELATFKARGWKNPGYHYTITADGVIHQLLDESLVSNGVANYNATSINVSYVGGIDVNNKNKAIDNRTPAQKKALVELLTRLKKKYPGAKIMGHRSIWGEDTPWKWKKACPCFNAIEEYKNL